MEPFWMILGEGVPTFRHRELASALKECERLSVENPGKTFVLLEALAECRKSDVQWKTTDQFEIYTRNGEVPF